MPKKKSRMRIEKPIFAATAARELGGFRAAKAAWSSRLLKPFGIETRGAVALLAATSPVPEENVVGVGIGEKLVDDRPTGIYALKFLVRTKYHEGQMSADHLLPKTVNGLPTDVEEVGLFRRFQQMANPRLHIRPAQPGCSIGFEDPQKQFKMAGTFGVLVKDRRAQYVLSNNHVLADEGRLGPGAPIFQPGLLDNGNSRTDQIAALTRFVPLSTTAANRVDCAIAKVLKAPLVSPDILYIGRPRGVANAAIDMVVHKFGRTTGYRVGKITSIDTDVAVQYEAGRLTFESQIIIVGMNKQPFSDAGDSGSLILERDSQQAVALLFAGSATHTIANHVGDVLTALKMTLV